MSGLFSDECMTGLKYLYFDRSASEQNDDLKNNVLSSRFKLTDTKN